MLKYVSLTSLLLWMAQRGWPFSVIEGLTLQTLMALTQRSINLMLRSVGCAYMFCWIWSHTNSALSLDGQWDDLSELGILI